MHVLIGIDGSEDAVDAGRQALPLLAATEVVTLLCVVEPPAAASAGLESGFAGGVVRPAEIDLAWAEVKREAADVLARAASALATSVPVEQIIETGGAGPTLCEVARHRSADVVVVGSRGRGAVKRALLGSVSAHVVNNAPCPVLVVRAQ